MEGIQRFFRGVPQCCREKMHWLVVLSLSLSLCLLFIWFPSSVLWSEKLKRPQFCYFRMGDSGDWVLRIVRVRCTIVCICDCVHVFVWHSSYTLCAFAHIYICFVFNKKNKKKSRLCIFSSLHAQTHLTQQQMAVCHQSVDSSRIFPWKESQRREPRVQMAVYSATSHPQGVMKEGLSYSRTPSQYLPWNGYVQGRHSKSF